MDYDLLLTELRNASLFDLYRLQAAIGRLLDDPARQELAKRQLRPGMEIAYFYAPDNRLIPARVAFFSHNGCTLGRMLGCITGSRYTG